jgi:hypothetical protein
MKLFKILIFSLLLAFLNISCSTNNSDSKSTDNKASVNVEESKEKNKVVVYYFHNARRCATCNAVEAESKKSLQELYGDDIELKVYSLESVDGELLAEKHGVFSQTLLIVSGDTIINITNEAFMHARNNPAKLKEIIKEKIDPLL